MSSDLCPKSMTFGPCGGTRPDGACEVDRRPCPFLDVAQRDVLARAASDVTRRPVALDLRGPAIVVDVRAPTRWLGDQRRLWQAVARGLDGCVALLGEHVDNPSGGDDAGFVDPCVAIDALASAGVTVIATVTGRDRDLAAARSTMARFADAGVTAIHCVTGDHPAALAIARPAWFGAEAVSLVTLANELGLPATVGESPASPGPRVARLGVKRAAGAAACILNHSGEVAELDAFADACRRREVDLPLIAPVPMVADRRAAAALLQFPGLRLPQRFADLASASEPTGAAIALAGAMAAELARSGRFVGVNLSGSATDVDPYTRIELTSRFVAAVREAWQLASG